MFTASSRRWPSDELSLINAQNNYDNAKADLVALMGLNVADDYQFVDPSVSVSLDSTELASSRAKYADMAALTNTALTYAPDYLGAKENYDASSSSVTMARARLLASLSARAGLNGNNEKNWRCLRLSDNHWGLNLSWSCSMALRQTRRSRMPPRHSATPKFPWPRRSGYQR